MGPRANRTRDERPSHARDTPPPVGSPTRTESRAAAAAGDVGAVGGGRHDRRARPSRDRRAAAVSRNSPVVRRRIVAHPRPHRRCVPDVGRRVLSAHRRQGAQRGHGPDQGSATIVGASPAANAPTESALQGLGPARPRAVGGAAAERQARGHRGRRSRIDDHPRGQAQGDGEPPHHPPTVGWLHRRGRGSRHHLR